MWLSRSEGDQRQVSCAGKRATVFVNRAPLGILRGPAKHLVGGASFYSFGCWIDSRDLSGCLLQAHSFGHGSEDRSAKQFALPLFNLHQSSLGYIRGDSGKAVWPARGVQHRECTRRYPGDGTVGLPYAEIRKHDFAGVRRHPPGHCRLDLLTVFPHHGLKPRHGAVVKLRARPAPYLFICRAYVVDLLPVECAEPKNLRDRFGDLAKARLGLFPLKKVLLDPPCPFGDLPLQQ